MKKTAEKKLELPFSQIKSEDILDGVLQGKNIFVMPGGADLPYCKKLNGIGNEKIRKFIEDGGFLYRNMRRCLLCLQKNKF